MNSEEYNERIAREARQDDLFIAADNEAEIRGTLSEADWNDLVLLMESPEVIAALKLHDAEDVAKMHEAFESLFQ